MEAKIKRFSSITIITLLVILVAVTGVFVWKGGILTKHNDSSAATEQKDVAVEKDKVTIGFDSNMYTIYPNCVYESSTVVFNSSMFEPLATFNDENKMIKYQYC